MTFKIFVRNWWRHNSEYPNGLEPDATGRKHTIGHTDTEEEAREIAQEYNRTHKPGRFSRKAEFEEIRR